MCFTLCSSSGTNFKYFNSYHVFSLSFSLPLSLSLSLPGLNKKEEKRREFLPIATRFYVNGRRKRIKDRAEKGSKTELLEDKKVLKEEDGAEGKNGERELRKKLYIRKRWIASCQDRKIEMIQERIFLFFLPFSLDAKSEN